MPEQDLADAPTHYYEGRDLEILADMPNYYRWIMKPFYPYLGKRVVEYGAGRGTISNLLASRVGDLELVEPSANLVTVLGQRFADQRRVRISDQSLEAHASQTPDHTVETVVMVNVLEHVEGDAKAVTELYRILKTGGHLCVFVPAMTWLFSDLDRRVGHYRSYQKLGLSKIIEEAGFEIVTIRYMDLIGTFPWWLLHRMLKRTDFGSPAIATVYDRIFVPLNRLIEAIMPLPFGKNILLIARKR